jgi:hypothetical protein
MLFFMTRSVIGFRGLVVTDRAAYAAREMLLGNREPEVRSRFCALFRTFNSQPVREKIQ